MPIVKNKKIKQKCQISNLNIANFNLPWLQFTGYFSASELTFCSEKYP